MPEDVTCLGRHRVLTGALGNLMLLRSYLKPSNSIWVLDPAFAAELYIYASILLIVLLFYQSPKDKNL